SARSETSRTRVAASSRCNAGASDRHTCTRTRMRDRPFTACGSDRSPTSSSTTRSSHGCATSASPRCTSSRNRARRMRGSPPRMRLRRYSLLALLACVALWAAPALAGPGPIPAPPVVGAKSYFVVAAKTGRELAAYEPDAKLAPASLTKLMTAYAIFKALEEEQIALDDEVTVSEKAWRTPGSRMFIEVGSRVKVEDLIMGLIVQSGNDAAVALSEYVAGTEAVFAEVMNRYAEALGMTGTHFVNSTGLPGKDHYSTARDLATLA